jgi:hypothetical protein
MNLAERTVRGETDTMQDRKNKGDPKQFRSRKKGFKEENRFRTYHDWAVTQGAQAYGGNSSR